MRFPDCTAFGHGIRGDQNVLRYILEYVAAEHAEFPPYEYLRRRAVFWRFLIFDRGK